LTSSQEGNEVDNTVIIALITSSSSVLVAITALLLNYRGFTAIDGRMAAMEARMAGMEARMSSMENRIGSLDGRLTSIENRLDRMYKAGL
jgi:hypothetical protein